MQISDRAKIDARIAGAFKAASEGTGASFDQLVTTAVRESDLRPDLASATSSAKGLFQFVDQTWFELIKTQGPSVGLERLADAITSDGKGGWTVADAKDKSRILSLRTDPLVASVMAGKFTDANAKSLTDSLGRKPTDGEVYAAHVLGAAGAVKLVRMAASEPTTAASLAFPRAAAANPGLFYGRDGKPVTAAELRVRLTGTTGAAADRIAEAHAAVAAQKATKIDPSTLAALVRAQAGAMVAGEGLGAGAVDRTVAERFARTALTEKSLPGASRDVAPPTGARIDGWRAKTSNDAFSVLVRSDGQTLAADAATAAGPAAEAMRTASASPLGLADAAAPRTSRIGGASGGIPFVDPTQPMRLSPEQPSTPRTATLTNVGAKSSRLMSVAALGAPAMPLPMVDGGRVVRPSREIAAPVTEVVETFTPSGLVAAGAARVRTVSIAPAPPAASPERMRTAAIGAGLGLAPTSSASLAAASTTSPAPASTTAPAASSASTAPAPQAARAAPRMLRPLDLLDLQRRAVAGL